MTVRAECLARLGKGKQLEIGEGVDGGHDKATREDKAEYSSARDLSWKSTETAVDGSKAKADHTESAAISKQLVVKTESSKILLPFVHAIMDVHILEQFVPPQFKMYDGTIDPVDHVKAFTNAIAFRTGSNAIWCRAFSLSLEGEALKWFNSLPHNSIENFEGLWHMVNRQFASSSAQDTTIFDLVNLK